MRVGIICSSGGSAFAEVAQACPHHEYLVITDRECGAEERCRELALPFIRIEEPSNERFSERAAAILGDWGVCDFVILFYARLITTPLLERFTVLNIHPSLLPAFKGMSGIKLAKRYGVRFFGATLHVASEEIDRGPIIAQACQPMLQENTLPYLEKQSFFHKVSLFLLAVELFENEHIHVQGGAVNLATNLAASDRLNPMLQTPAYIEYLHSLQEREGAAFL